MYSNNSFGTPSASNSYTPNTSTFVLENGYSGQSSTSSVLPNPLPEIFEDPSWYINGGATNHITNDLGKLINS